MTQFISVNKMLTLFPDGTCQNVWVYRSHRGVCGLVPVRGWRPHTPDGTEDYTSRDPKNLVELLVCNRQGGTDVRIVGPTHTVQIGL